MSYLCRLILIVSMFAYPLSTYADLSILPKKKANTISTEIVNSNELLENVVKGLFKSSQLLCNVPEWKLKTSLDHDVSLIKDAVRAYGYYSLSSKREVVRENNCWKVKVEIIDGPRTHIAGVDVKITGEASNDKAFNKYINGEMLSKGDPLLHKDYEKLKNSMLSIASKRGYLDAVFDKKELKIDKDNHSAFITLHFDSKKRYRIGEIIIEQEALVPDLFSKFVDISSGEYYDDKQLVSTYQNLSESGYYSSVDVTPLLDKKNNHQVPVLIKVTKSKPKKYSVGIGASTDIGPRFKASYTNKLSNTKGHSHRSTLSLSPVISSISSAYKIPVEKAQTDFYEFSTSATHENTDTSTSDSFNVGASQSYLLENEWSRLFFLQYSIDDFDVGEDSDTTALLRPGIGFSKTQSNSLLRPTKGYRFNVELTAASAQLLSDVSFIQAQLNTKYIHSVGKDARLLGRLDLGYTEISSFDELPSNLRFFAGGDNSLRGYDYESLGPKDDAGDVIGGKGLVVTSLEVDYSILNNWAGALFVDAGNAFNDTDIDVKVSGGFGVRWNSPVGPIRVDIGFPIDDPGAEDTWRLHFSLGPDL